MHLHRRRLLVAVAALLGLLPLGPPAQAQNRSSSPDGISHVRIRSELLSSFWGRDHHLEAAVVVPPGHDPASERLPICFYVHGFGGSYRAGFLRGPGLRAEMAAATIPRMLHVFLDGRCSMGHHEFADSVNNGPWGSALVQELIPAIETRFGGAGSAEGRFLTGHSSGGWSTLWLQVSYPDVFGGTWSTAPDPVDFRDFTGIDIYAGDNAYFDADGREIPLVRRGDQWVTTFKDFARREHARGRIDGQMDSFDAVFSPRGDDGRPMRLFDRETGAIDRDVARAWERYDISLILRRRFDELGPKLRGKLNIFVGTLDTYRLEGAVRLLEQELRSLGSDAVIEYAEGRDHGSLFRPHPELWPDGLMHRIHREMGARYERSRDRAPAESGR